MATKIMVIFSMWISWTTYTNFKIQCFKPTMDTHIYLNINALSRWNTNILFANFFPLVYIVHFINSSFCIIAFNRLGVEELSA